MGIFKDLVSLSVLVISLLALNYVSNYFVAMVIISVITVLYVIKHIRMHKAIKKELETRVYVFEKMFDSSTDVILYRDLRNSVVACNMMLVKEWGLSKKEIIGNTIANNLRKIVSDSKKLDKVLENVEFYTINVISQDKPEQFFQAIEFIDGHPKFYNVLISPVKDENKNIIGTTLVARDITEQYLSDKHARENEEKLKCILENMPTCAFLKDEKGQFVVGSASFEKAINCTNDKMMDLDLNHIFNTEYLKYVKKEDAEVYKTKKTLVTERKVMFPKTSFWGRVHKSPVFDENGNVKYLVIMYENIDSEKEIEHQKEYFIETLIHDLKVPTIAQLRGLELIRNETIGKISIDQKELITQIESSCRYILDMISMVLKTYRLENGQKRLVLENVSISELFIECFQEMEQSAEEKNIQFVYSPEKKEDILVQADKSDLKSVIINLLSNAVMYSIASADIVVNVSSHSSRLRVDIVSKGIVLSERECDVMFDKLEDKTPKYTTIGHGIGLYLCKKIIESHQGYIFASTDGKKYNKFTFILPIKQPKITIKSNLSISKELSH